MKRTKIVCTIGPATMDKEVLKKMMIAGMNVGRINFSHGNYKDQAERIDLFKKVRDEYGDWNSIIIVIDSTNTYNYSVYSSGYNIFRYISESDNYIENINSTLDKCIKFYNNRFNSLKIRHYNYVEFVLYNDIIYIEKVKDSKIYMKDLNIVIL